MNLRYTSWCIFRKNDFHFFNYYAKFYPTNWYFRIDKNLYDARFSSKKNVSYKLISFYSKFYADLNFWIEIFYLYRFNRYSSFSTFFKKSLTLKPFKTLEYNRILNWCKWFIREVHAWEKHVDISKQYW